MYNKYFTINSLILDSIDDYHFKSLEMQKFHLEGNKEGLTLEELEINVNDDLIFNVPIYDMLDRKYASFCSLLEALERKEKDPKGNGIFFLNAPKITEMDLRDALGLFYLFRLCGSGINYTPKIDKPFGTHGFGNFWVVDSIANQRFKLDEWLEDLRHVDGPFTDSKGYLLPMISYKDIKSGHLKRFILEEIDGILNHMEKFLVGDRKTLIGFIDHMNLYLKSRGFRNQNFVLSATSADVAEYFPGLIDPKSSFYAGTNAKKCIKAIFTKNKGVKNETFFIEAINFIADRYDSEPYSVEDSRMCDVYRYLYNFQSKQHIEKNRGVVYKNNSIIKQFCVVSGDDYDQYIKNILG